MARNVLRKPAVLQATGWSNSTLYTKIAEGMRGGDDWRSRLARSSAARKRVPAEALRRRGAAS
jgi:hypothetical protein